MAAPAFAENQTAKAKYLAPFDADKNGQMTVAEHKAGRAERFNGMDTNKDGKLSKEEFTKGHGDWHSKADSNKDGVVELGEYVTFFCGEEPKQGDPKKNQDAKKHYIDCVAHRHAIYAVADVNKDGKVSAEEHATAANFDKMDTNGDQMIALDEFYAFQIEVDAPKKDCPMKKAAKCKGDCKKGGAEMGCKGCKNCKGDCKKSAEAKAEAKAETPAPAAKTADKK